MRGGNHGARRSLRRAMDVEGRGLGEERLHAEDRGTGRRDWCSVRPREKEEREREREGEPNTRDIRCVPQDLGQRGVAVIRPGKGRKLAGLGERGKHTRGGGGGNSSSSTGGGGGGRVRGRLFSSGKAERGSGRGPSRRAVGLGWGQTGLGAGRVPQQRATRGSLS